MCRSIKVIIIALCFLLATGCSSQRIESEKSETTVETTVSEQSTTEATVEETKVIYQYSEEQLNNIELMYNYANIAAWTFTYKEDEAYLEYPEYNQMISSSSYRFWSAICSYCDLYLASEKDIFVSSYFCSDEELIAISQVMFDDFTSFPSITDDCWGVRKADGGYEIEFVNVQPFEQPTNFDYSFLYDGSIKITFDIYEFGDNPENPWLAIKCDVIVIPDNDDDNPLKLTITSVREEFLDKPIPTSTPSPTPMLNDWKSAYAYYITEIDDQEYPMGYALVYIDNDDIPELFVMGGAEASGENIVTFYNGELVTQHLSRIGSVYIEKNGIILNDCGHMDYYPLTIYELKDGVFYILAEGLSGWVGPNCEHVLDEHGQPVYEYYWQNEQVANRDEYRQCVNSIFDENRATRPSNFMSAEEILELISRM